MRQRWEEQLAGYVRASFRAVVLGMAGSQSVQLVSRLVVALTLWLGAHQVIAGELSVGQLIAFNMLAGQVSGPILRLAQLWQDFQIVVLDRGRIVEEGSHRELLARPTGLYTRLHRMQTG